MQSYLATYPSGPYSIVIKGQYVGYPLSEVANTFTLTLTDPCSNTDLTIIQVPNQDLFIGAALPFSYQILVTDTVSDSYGK